MRDHPCGNGLRRLSAVMSVLVLCLAAAGRAGDLRGKYARHEMVIRGTALHQFNVAGEDATAVIGGFSLTMGQRKFSGDKAIIWMKEVAAPGGTRRDITLYIEGRARSSTGRVAALAGRAMLVTLRQQGRVRAQAKLVAGPPGEEALYARALVARQDEAREPVEEPDRHAAPRLLAARGPAGADGATSKPATAPPRAKQPAGGPPRAPAAKPARPLPGPVMFRADKFSTELVDPDDPNSRRITIASGNVYLAQGSPDSRLFLELRCQSAVLYTRAAKKVSGAKAAEDPSDAGGIGAVVGLGGGGETIEAAYLEGDVVIARGERYMRGPRAFYNFKTDRAYVVDGVYRTVQVKRGTPIFVRFKTARSAAELDDKGRKLPNREVWFSDARVTTSDFYSPTYNMAAKTVRLKDVTAYDETGQPMGPEAWEVWLTHSTFEIGGIPVFYWPYMHEDFKDGHTALKRAQVGDGGRRFGYGIETEWQLFRLLGLPTPRGFKGQLELSYYDRGTLAGVDLTYARRTWSGGTNASAMIDNRSRDDFGDDRQDTNIPNYRGRFSHRHKQFLGDDWMLQAELSWSSDGGFVEMFYPAEFYNGKTRETLLYAKKQTDNQALTVLLQYRLNRFDTQTESAPDMGYYLLGEPLISDTITLFSESRAGMKRWRPAKSSESATRKDTRLFPRLDTREEVNVPFHFGPVNVVPYAVVRGTYWDDTRVGFDEQERAYGQVGARANLHLWRVYPNAESRLLDVHRLKHVITPEVAFFASDTNGVDPSELLPMDSGVEEHLMRQGGYTVGVRQRLLTKRGRPGNRKTAEWMRLDVMGGGFRDTSALPADGRFVTYRPESSFARSFINTDYAVNISESTTLLSDANYDPRNGQVGTASVSMNVERDPRLSYFGGVRYIRTLDSSVATVGVTYQISRKYSVSFFEQYDLDFEGGDNLITRLMLTRKLPRWYIGLTLVFDRGGEGDDVGVYLMFWPEGAPEVKLGSGRRGYWQSNYNRN